MKIPSPTTPARATSTVAAPSLAQGTIRVFTTYAGEPSRTLYHGTIKTLLIDSGLKPA